MSALRNSIIRGGFLGLIILVVGAAVISSISERQALHYVGFFEAPADGIEIASLVLVSSDGSFEILAPDEICHEASPFDLGALVEKFPDRRYAVSTVFSSEFIPWQSSVVFTLSDTQTVQPGNLLGAIFEASAQCEVELGARSIERCVLVVSELAEEEDGGQVMRLAGCQIVDNEDYYLSVAEFGSGIRQKDIFAGVSPMERYWHSLREAFIKISAEDQN